MEEPIEQKFPETADIETSNDDYATRFRGAAGEFMLDVQERITLDFLKALKPADVLDVGGGHGQLAIPVADQGIPITVLGSDASCSHRIRDIVEDGRCTFTVGNVINLPYPDDAFDVVICFRLVTHCTRWPELIRELCRVARRAVIVDYPTSQSVNAIAPALFNAKKKLEVNTRHWELFRHHQILESFAEAGFGQARVKKQFFLPMVLHRMLKCRPLSAGLEGLCRGLGLTRLWGSPVIIQMAPRGPDA